MTEGDELVMAWRRSLSDVDVRSYAAEYMRGGRQPDQVDAYAEYLVRFGGKANAPSKAKRKRKRSTSTYK